MSLECDKRHYLDLLRSATTEKTYGEPVAHTERQSYGTDAAQFVEFWDPGQAPRAAAILIHGGYWRDRYGLDLMTPLAAYLSARGISVANIEYRRIASEQPSPDGVWDVIAEDVAAAIKLAVDRFGDDTPTCIIGHSAGGQLALWAAAHLHRGNRNDSPIAFVVALAPVADLVDADRRDLSDGAAALLLGGDHASQALRYQTASPMALVPLGVQQLLVHGRNDVHVPFEMTNAYASAAVAAGDQVELLAPEDVDHFDVIDPAAPIWRAIEARLGLVFGDADL